MPFDVEGATKAGYSDSEIAEHLAKSQNFDLTGARKSGYSDREIVNHLNTKQAAPAQPKTYEQRMSEARSQEGIGSKLATPFKVARAVIQNAPIEFAEELVEPGGYYGQRSGKFAQAADKLKYHPEGATTEAVLDTLGELGRNSGLEALGPMGGAMSTEMRAGSMGAKAGAKAIAAKSAQIVKPVIEQASNAAAKGAEAVGRAGARAKALYSTDVDQQAAAMFQRIKGTDKLTPGEIATLKDQTKAILATASTVRDAESKLANTLKNRGLELEKTAQDATEKAAEVKARGQAAVSTIGPETSDSDTGSAIMQRANQVQEKRKGQLATAGKEGYEKAMATAQSEEAEGKYLSDNPNYKALVKSLEERRDATKAEDLKAGLSRIIRELSPAKSGGEETEEAAGAGKVSGKITKTSKTPETVTKPTFKAIDEVRRKIAEGGGDEASGYAAVDAHTRSEVSSRLNAIMRGHNADYGKYLDTYRDLAPGRNPYLTRTGKAVTGREKFDPDILKNDPKDIPAKVFKSKKEIAQVIDMMDGDRNAVIPLARGYLSSKLKEMPVASARAAIFNPKGKFYDLVEEFPELKPSVEAYLKRAAEQEKNAAALKQTAARARAESGTVTSMSQSVDKAVNDALTSSTNRAQMINLVQSVSRTPEGRAALKQSIDNAIQKMDADTMLAKYDQMRPAISAGGLHSPAEMAKMDNVVHVLRDLRAKTALSAADFTPEIKAQMAPIRRDTAIASALLTAGTAVTGHGLGPVAGAGIAVAEAGGVYAGRAARLKAIENAYKVAIQKMIDDPKFADEALAKPTAANVAKLKKDLK